MYVMGRVRVDPLNPIQVRPFEIGPSIGLGPKYFLVWIKLSTFQAFLGISSNTFINKSLLSLSIKNKQTTEKIR